MKVETIENSKGEYVTMRRKAVTHHVVARTVGKERGDAMNADRLEGWKEMAAHLGRSVRTVQRWERESGLPVHRLAVGDKPQVFAYCAELDRWRGKREDQGRASWVRRLREKVKRLLTRAAVA
jgi:hypothetical protein